MEAFLFMLDGLIMILIVLWVARALRLPIGEMPAGLFAWRDIAPPARKDPPRRSGPQHLRTR